MQAPSSSGGVDSSSSSSSSSRFNLEDPKSRSQEEADDDKNSRGARANAQPAGLSPTMSRFTAGFETLHAKGMKDKRNYKSVMFGSGAHSTLSRSTQKLVEKLARQSHLNRDQMRALGSLASAGRNSLQSAPGRLVQAPSMATQFPAHKQPFVDHPNQVHRMRHG